MTDLFATISTRDQCAASIFDLSQIVCQVIVNVPQESRTMVRRCRKNDSINDDLSRLGATHVQAPWAARRGWDHAFNG